MKQFTLIVFFSLYYFTGFSQDWQQVSSLPEIFHTHHSFGFSLEGKGFIVAGTDYIGLKNEFYEYDPSADTWTRLEDYPGPRRGFGIGDVYDGKAYLGFGSGDSGFLKDLWVFDPVTYTWEELASCTCVSRTHPAFVAHNGKIYLGLGGSALGNLNDWWVYDIATDTWEQKATFPGAKRHHPYQFAMGDYVYVGMGHGNGIFNDLYRYDPVSDTWEEMASLPDQGRVAGTQFSFEGNGYVLSGDGDDHNSMDEGEFWMYNPELNEWSQLPSHPGTSRWAPASFVIDGEVYLINGQTEGPNTDYVYVQDVYKMDLTDPFLSAPKVAPISDKLTVYPNPFQQEINLDLEDIVINESDYQIKVYTTNLQVVYQKTSYEQNLNLSQLAAGLYWVEIVNDKTTYRQLIAKY